MTDAKKTETEAAATLAAKPQVLLGASFDNHMVVALPPGWSSPVVDLEHLKSAPRRARGRVFVHDATSFVDAVERRSEQESTSIYADESTNQLVAILNDDGANETVGGWRDYTVALHLRATPEWSHWRNQDGALMDQEKFAEHVEDGLSEIASPAPADLLEIAQTFHATTSAAFKQGIRLASGATQLVYEEDVQAKAGKAGTLEIPEFIGLVVAPFYGSARYEVSARFRYRLGRGSFVAGYKLDRPHEVERAAFADVRTHVKEGLEGWHFIAGPAPEPIVSNGHVKEGLEGWHFIAGPAPEPIVSNGHRSDE